MLETQAGKSALPDRPSAQYGLGRRHRHVGVERAGRRPPTWCSPSARGCRISPPAHGRCSRIRTSRSSALNAQAFDAGKHRRAAAGRRRKGRARRAGDAALRTGQRPTAWTAKAKAGKAKWQEAASAATAADQCRAALRRAGDRRRAAGLRLRRDHRLRRRRACRANCTSSGRPARRAPTTSNMAIPCMGYEIAGGLGVKLARPDDEVVVMVGDGSYLMMNSEIATSVMLGVKLTVVVLDNRGFGCINRLQMATGGANFNNLLAGRQARGAARDRLPQARRGDGRGGRRRPPRSPSWKRRWPRRRRTIAPRSSSSTPIRWSRPSAGGHWWDVAVPEVSERGGGDGGRARHMKEALKQQRASRLERQANQQCEMVGGT